MVVFETLVLIRFRHCDPAGIVFYPRYFEILNDVIEDWFARLGWPFGKMIVAGGIAVPLVTVQAEFAAPSRLGETLRVTIEIVAMGRTSCALAVVLSGPDGTARVRLQPKMVCVARDTLRPEPWPDRLRTAMVAPAVGIPLSRVAAAS